jgi:PHD/YefM family antitoxin component YafN of YafNO toxin-antitoxin module
LKEIELSSAKRPLADYAMDLKKDEVLVVTKGRRPIAAVVSLHDLDRESVFLGFHPKFLRILERSRADIAAGRTYSLDEVRQAVFGKQSSRKPKGSRPRRLTVSKRAL